MPTSSGPSCPRRRKRLAALARSAHGLRRILVVLLASAGALLFATVAIATDPPAFPTPVPAGFDTIVLLAEEIVDIKNEVTIVSGDVIGNGVASEIVFDKDGAAAAGFAMKADSITIESGVDTASSFSCNTLDDKTNTVTCAAIALPLYAALPPFLSASASSNDINIDNDQSLTLGPGSYGTLAGKKNVVLTLTGGVYDFAGFQVDENTQVLFQAPTILRVSGGLHGKNLVVFGPDSGATSPPTAADIRVYVGGDVSFDQGSEVLANFFLDNGTAELKKEIDFTGAILATEIVVGTGSTITLDTAFKNLAPIAVDDGISVLEGGTAITLVGGAASLLANDSDPNNDGLSLTTTAVSAPANGTVVLVADGTFTYTHDGSETTVDSFVYEVCDDGVAPGPLCSTATVAISITPVNDAPVAVPDTLTLDEGATSTTLDGGATSLLANDTDAENDTLSATVVVGQATTNGTVDINADGSFSYTHDGSETLADSFTYEVCDDGTPSECAIGTVSVTVNPVNDDPTANPQTLTTEFAVTITLTGSDPEGDSLTFSVLAGPTLGTLGAVTGVDATSATVDYTPPASPDEDDIFDSFTFQVDDGNGGLDSALVSINLIPQNSPPVTGNDTIRTVQGGTTSALLGGGSSLLTNDFDPEGGTLTLQAAAVSGPSNGTVTLNPAGTFSYTHTNLGTNSDAFVYQVCDDGVPVECSNGQVTVQVFSASIDVTVTFAGDGGGTVTSSPAGINCDETTPLCMANIASPDRILLSVIAASGSAFAGFSGDADCSDGDLAPDGNKSCIATFNAVTPPPTGFFNLTVSKTGSGGGTIETVPAGINCGAACASQTEAFPANQRIVLFPTPDAGSKFVNWNGTDDCLDGDLIRLPGANASCVAVFDTVVVPPSVDTLTVNVVGAGSVRSSPVGIVCESNSTCSADFATGEVVTLAARPLGGTSVSWSGDPQCVGSSFLLSVTVGVATNCTATFSP